MTLKSRWFMKIEPQSSVMMQYFKDNGMYNVSMPSNDGQCFLSLSHYQSRCTSANKYMEMANTQLTICKMTEWLNRMSNFYEEGTQKFAWIKLTEEDYFHIYQLDYLRNYLIINVSAFVVADYAKHVTLSIKHLLQLHWSS